METLLEFYRDGRAERHASSPASSARWRACSSIRSSCSASSASRPASRPARRIRAQRSRAGVAPVVLPVEQHPGRRAARVARARRAEGPGGARAAGAADARGSARRRAGQQLRRPVAVAARAEERHGPTRRTSTAICGSSFQRETELLFRTIVREDRSVVDLLDADFTFVDERLARHYGIPDVRGAACAASRCRRTARGAACSDRAAS